MDNMNKSGMNRPGEENRAEDKVTASDNNTNLSGQKPAVPRPLTKAEQELVNRKLGISSGSTVAFSPQQKASEQNGATRQVPAQPKDAGPSDATRQVPAQPKDAGPSDATRPITPQQRTGEGKIASDVKTDGKKKREKKKGTVSEGSNTVMSLVKCMAYITVVLIVSIIISVFVILSANDIYGFVKSTDPVEITIPEGADLGDVADILHDNKVINYKWLFKMKNKGTSDFKAGTYTVSASMSYDALVAEFREKIPTGVSWITIPEGFTTDEIIDLMVESGIGERERYVEVINNYDFDFWFIDELGEDWASDGRIYRLDGYLFPDTYQFYNASSEETVIKKLLSRFNQVFVKSYKERAAELGYTVDEILTLASIIEKEAANQSEFGDVSSVFHNRLNDPANFPRLESDATVVYSIQHETGVRPNLTGEDLERDDPYNSYKVHGLVPGPIANPSNSAILAALNPKNTQFYYFVSNGQKTYFAKTLQEHNANKAMYLKGASDANS